MQQYATVLWHYAGGENEVYHCFWPTKFKVPGTVFPSPYDLPQNVAAWYTILTPVTLPPFCKLNRGFIDDCGPEQNSLVLHRHHDGYWSNKIRGCPIGMIPSSHLPLRRV
jgi:hypothetical protein